MKKNEKIKLVPFAITCRVRWFLLTSDQGRFENSSFLLRIGPACPYAGGMESTPLMFPNDPMAWSNPVFIPDESQTSAL